MGKPITRLNPKVESHYKILFNNVIEILLTIITFLPEEISNKRGPKPYDDILILVLFIFQILLRKTCGSWDWDENRLENL